MSLPSEIKVGNLLFRLFVPDRTYISEEAPYGLHVFLESGVDKGRYEDTVYWNASYAYSIVHGASSPEEAVLEVLTQHREKLYARVQDVNGLLDKVLKKKAP